MNKSNGNMYEWVTHTWNPLGGRCPHSCTYCSTNKLMKYPAVKTKYSGAPRLYIEDLVNNQFGNGKTIFVCAQNDLFANLIPLDWVKKILDHCKHFDNIYLFQSKNPLRMNDLQVDGWFPDKSIFCTTIETNRIYTDIMCNCPTPMDRAVGMWHLKGRKFVTIEPVMDFDLPEMVNLIELCAPEQVNIGADSGNNHLPEPSKEKLLALIDELKKFTTIANKKNLNRILTT